MVGKSRSFYREHAGQTRDCAAMARDAPSLNPFVTMAFNSTLLVHHTFWVHKSFPKCQPRDVVECHSPPRTSLPLFPSS